MHVTEFFINITSDNPEALVAFYRDIVGLPQRTDMGPHSYAAGGAILGFDEHKDTKGRAAQPQRLLLDLTVGDAKAERERLEAKGVVFTRKEGQEAWGGLISTFNDPDGNIVQLFQLPEGMAPPLEPGQVGGFTLDLTSEDPARLLAFYRDVVGLAPFPAIGPNGLRVTETGFLHVDTHSETQGPTAEPNRILIDLWVEDLRAERARMEAAGARFFRKEGVEFWGGVISACLDPDGNIVQLIQYDPALDTTRASG